MTDTTPVSVYRGWPIYTLPNYTTPYYYAQARTNRKTWKPVEGPSNNFASLRAVERRIDKHIASGNFGVVE